MVSLAGTLKRVEDDRVILRNNELHDKDAYTVASGAVVALNGIACPLADLREGDGISLALETKEGPATAVIATR